MSSADQMFRELGYEPENGFWGPGSRAFSKKDDGGETVIVLYESYTAKYRFTGPDRICRRQALSHAEVLAGAQAIKEMEASAND